MAILKIARMGHPVLRQPAEPIADPTAAAVKNLVADMLDTVFDANGTGLAAPQVHVGARILIYMIGTERLTGRPLDEAQDWLTLVNPVIEPLGQEMELGWEGCLSVPGLRGAVPRWVRVRYRGVTPEGEAVDRTVEGFHARVVQHEMDHLDGILYPQRMTDLRLLQFNEEAARYPIALPGTAEAAQS
ncbi:MAG: peptide deformylase [Stellaceae bacterium]